MTKEELIELFSLDENTAEKIAERFEAVRAEYEEKLARAEREEEIRELLRENGARNVKAARALLENTDGDDYREKVLAEIATLKRNEATSFLFYETEKNGFYPAYASEKLPGGEEEELREELLDARRKNDTLRAIRIKQRAAEKGFSLL